MKDGAYIPLRVHTIVISTQHAESITMDVLRKEIMEKVVKVCVFLIFRPPTRAQHCSEVVIDNKIR